MQSDNGRVCGDHSCLNCLDESVVSAITGKCMGRSIGQTLRRSRLMDQYRQALAYSLVFLLMYQSSVVLAPVLCYFGIRIKSLILLLVLDSLAPLVSYPLLLYVLSCSNRRTKVLCLAGLGTLLGVAARMVTNR